MNNNKPVASSANKPSGRRYHFDLIRDGVAVRDPGGLICAMTSTPSRWERHLHETLRYGDRT
jgi:hypothetical protein